MTLKPFINLFALIAVGSATLLPSQQANAFAMMTYPIYTAPTTVAPSFVFRRFLPTLRGPALAVSGTTPAVLEYTTRQYALRMASELAGYMDVTKPVTATIILDQGAGEMVPGNTTTDPYHWAVSFAGLPAGSVITLINKTQVSADGLNKGAYYTGTTYTPPAPGNPGIILGPGITLKMDNQGTIASSGGGGGVTTSTVDSNPCSDLNTMGGNPAMLDGAAGQDGLAGTGRCGTAGAFGGAAIQLDGGTVTWVSGNSPSQVLGPVQ